MKYDAGIEIGKKTNTTRIPALPKIVEHQYIQCHNSEALILRAMGSLEGIKDTNDVIDGPTTSTSRTGQQTGYQTIEVLAHTDMKAPYHTVFTPIGTNTAWAIETNTGYSGNTTKVCLVNNTNNILYKFETDAKVHEPSIHPITKQLFFILNDGSMRNVDTLTGKTTIVLKFESKLDRLKVTHDHHALIGSANFSQRIHKFKLTGKLVKQYPHKYVAYDIDHYPQTNAVVISQAGKGLTFLNSDLNEIGHFKRAKTESINHQAPYIHYKAIFDKNANVIVADSNNKEIFVLSGDTYRLIQVLQIEDLSCPGHIRLHENTLWVE